MVSNPIAENVLGIMGKFSTLFFFFPLISDQRLIERYHLLEWSDHTSDLEKL